MNASFRFRREDALIAGSSGLLPASLYLKLDALSRSGTPEPAVSTGKPNILHRQRSLKWSGYSVENIPQRGSIFTLPKRRSDTKADERLLAQGPQSLLQI
jgi:hypothetical protein